MGAHDSLKSLVRQYIKTNGQNEITGQILQDVLIAMIDDLGITIDPTPTKNSSNAVASGGAFDMIQDVTNVNAIESVDGKIYNDYQAGDIFFIVDNNVRKYRVALVAGTADAEHPVTISPVNFYYALNSADAINLSLTLKTVSTEQQSLSAQQKAQARTNIAAISYDQQSLSADQQVQAQNNMVGKAYNAAQFSGLGKKVLAKNIEKVSNVDHNYMTQAFFKNGNNLITNTVFVIQYDYELKENVEIGDGCTLEFDGGSIKGNYTLTGNNTRIKASDVAIFSQLTIAGTWNCPRITSKWFSDVTSNNRIKQLFNLTNANIQNEVVIDNGEYTVSVASEKGSVINLLSNTVVNLLGTIKLSANSLNECSMFKIASAKNITIKGTGIIQGDKTTHTGSTGEGGDGINISGGEDITIQGVTSKDCWGDCIYVGGWSGISKNIVIQNVTLTNGRRQGLSVTWAENVLVENCIISGISGTNPEFGIDLEPNTTCHVQNVVINNVAFDTLYGILMLGGDDTRVNRYIRDVTVTNCKFANSAIPFIIGSSDNININNCDINITTRISDTSYSTLSYHTIHFSGSYGVTFKNNIVNCSVEESGISLFYLYGGINVNIDSNRIDSKKLLASGNWVTPTFSNNNITLYSTIYNSTSANLFLRFVGNRISCPSGQVFSGNRFYLEKNDIICTAENADTVMYIQTGCELISNTITVQGNVTNRNVIGLMGVGNKVIDNVIVIDAEKFSTYSRGIGSDYADNIVSGNMMPAAPEKILRSTQFKTLGEYTRKSGATADRPTDYVIPGTVYFDETLGKPIFKAVSGWVDATGTSV